MITVSHHGLTAKSHHHHPASPSNPSDDDDGSIDAVKPSPGDAHAHGRVGVHTPIASHMHPGSDGSHLQGHHDAEPDAEADPDADAESRFVAAANAVNGPPSASGTPRERHSLSLDQRRALRRWANSQTTRPSHKTCIEWFYTQYGQLISQSTVSHSLSPKYSRLDGDTPQLSGSRLRFGNWPDVEKVVLLWYQQVQASGRNPTNEELGEKAKMIFSQLPRYRDESPPEFSPGWIHRFKKRYGLLIRRQRRHSDRQVNPAEDIAYLADCVPRILTISADTSPAAIRESILRVVGVESSLHTCALVRDEILRRAANPAVSVSAAAMVAAVADGSPGSTSSPVHGNPQAHAHHHQQPQSNHHQPQHMHHPQAQQQPGQPGSGNGPGQDHAIYTDEDAEAVLQSALRQLQQEEEEAEVNAAAVREERERAERSGPNQSSLLSTPTGPRGSGGVGGGGPGSAPTSSVRFSVGQDPPVADLSLTPMPSNHDRAQRCPFCINTRLLRTVKDAIDHMSTHVVV